MSHIWMPLYVADYLAKTGHLTTTEHGAYLLLIMQYWSQGSLPDNDKILAQITRLRVERWKTVRPQLEHFFTVELGKQWKHYRIDGELKKAADLREKRQAAADKRWCNSNANAQQMHTQPQSPIQKESKVVSFSLGRKGGEEMPPEQRLALFQRTLAESFPDKQLGWRLVGEANDPESANHLIALKTCKIQARNIGKGWPHQWPK